MRDNAMKSKIIIRINAVLIALSLVITSIGYTNTMKVYAEDGGQEFWEEEPTNPESEPEPAPEPAPEPEPAPQPEPTPEPEPEPEYEYEPDPFDYNLICYTPSISFGAVNYGDITIAKQFNIVNVGNTSFPLTWEEVDPNTAFYVGSVSGNDYLNPGESATFSVSPNNELAPGGYSARLIFYSANDIRRHHTAFVDITVTVLDDTPYITGIEISPGSVSLPAGKSYTFSASVRGGNGYDPSVTWSLTGNQSQGTTIDSNGTVTVGINEPASSFAVLATSRQDPSYVDRAIVNVTRVDHVVSVKAEPAEGGAVAGGGSVTDGGSVNVSASANNNYSFDGWYEGNSLISTSRSFTLNDIRSDRNLVAKFNRNSCYIKTSVNDVDAGSVTNSGSVAYGGRMTIKAKANNGYRFIGFVENKKTISESESLELNNITSDRDITAVFERITCKVTIYTNPNNAGKYTGGGNYYKGTNVELTTVPNDGYEFTGWSMNGQIVSYDYRLIFSNIQSDVNITANFKKKDAKTFRIVSGVANEGGNISPSGESTVAEGGSITYNIVPSAGYNILTVAVDGKKIGAVASYTFNNVKENHSISAAFVKKTVEPASNSGSSSEKPKDTPKKNTEYSAETAAQGAVKEPEVIFFDKDSAKDESTVLTEEQYSDDVYVEAIEVPMDATPNVDTVMARHDLDEDTLRFLIKDKAVKPLLKEAYEDGILKITVNNTYASDTQETAAGLYFSQPTLINFEEVIEDSLTEEEAFAVLNGTPISFNIDICENTATIDSGEKKVMQSKLGYKPVSYFDFTIMKTSDGDTTIIENTGKALEVMVQIPQEYRKKGRKFVVIRNHNGVIDILENLSNSEEQVTFRTDRFSQYAIAYEVVNTNKLVLQFAIIGTISFILAFVCYINLIKYRRRARKGRK